MPRTERRPKAADIVIPVYVPSNSGETEIQVGKGSLKAGTLVIEFKDTLGGVAIQRLFERGSILGLQFVMIAEDDRNLAKQVAIENEEAEAAELETIPEEEVKDE